MERERQGSETPLDAGSADREREQRGGPTESGEERERIARRAYERFEARGAEHGHDQDDWLEAERELRRSGEGKREA